MNTIQNGARYAGVQLTGDPIVDRILAEPYEPTPQRTPEEWAAWRTQQAKEAAEWSEGRVNLYKDPYGGSNG